MTRWWGVAALALSIGLNAGLLVAVLQQRWQEPPVAAPPLPAEEAAPALDAGWTVVQPRPGAGEGALAGSVAEPPFGLQDAAAMDAAGTVVGPPADVAADRARATAGVDGHDVARLAGSEEPGELVPGPQRDGEPRREVGPPLERLEEMAERLGVPAADRPRLFAIQRRFFTATHEQRLRLEASRRELRAELVGPQPDRARIDRLVRQSAELQVGLESALVDHVFAAREVLDGEAERRYLHLLSRLGPGGPGGPGGRGPGAGAPPPRWQRPPRGDRLRRPGGRPPGRSGGPGGWDPPVG